MPPTILATTSIADVPELIEAVRLLAERLYPGAQYAAVVIRLEEGIPDAVLPIPLAMRRWPRTGKPLDPNAKP